MGIACLGGFGSRWGWIKDVVGVRRGSRSCGISSALLHMVIIRHRVNDDNGGRKVDDKYVRLAVTIKVECRLVWYLKQCYAGERY